MKKLKNYFDEVFINVVDTSNVLSSIMVDITGLLEINNISFLFRKYC
jgi:hypothetical protein